MAETAESERAAIVAMLTVWADEIDPETSESAAEALQSAAETIRREEHLDAGLAGFYASRAARLKEQEIGALAASRSEVARMQEQRDAAWSAGELLEQQMDAREERLRALVAEWRAQAERIAGYDNKVEGALSGCADDLEEALSEAGDAGQPITPVKWKCKRCGMEGQRFDGEPYPDCHRNPDGVYCGSEGDRKP